MFYRWLAFSGSCQIGCFVVFLVHGLMLAILKTWMVFEGFLYFLVIHKNIFTFFRPAYSGVYWRYLRVLCSYITL